MKKKNTLPKEFQALLKHLKRLDDALGITLKPYGDKKEIFKQGMYREREMVLDQIWGKWPRKTVLSKDVLQMRGNALKNCEVNDVLFKYQVRIEDCALVDVIDERYIGSQYEQPCPANSAPESILNHLQKYEHGNSWKAWFDYYWGGPKDQIKILFKRSNNNRYKIIGLIEMFPEKKTA